MFVSLRSGKLAHLTREKWVTPNKQVDTYNQTHFEVAENIDNLSRYYSQMFVVLYCFRSLSKQDSTERKLLWIFLLLLNFLNSILFLLSELFMIEFFIMQRIWSEYEKMSTCQIESQDINCLGFF